MMLKTAFCGCSLRTGSIVLGVIWLLADLGQIIAYITQLAGAETGHRFGAFVALCISLFHFLGNVLLLLGADKGKAQWVKYAVMNHFVSLVLAVISVVCLSIYYREVPLLLAGIVVTGLAGYCWMVIYSFYWHLIEITMTETQAQLETSALTKPTGQSTGLQDENQSSSSLAY